MNKQNKLLYKRGNLLLIMFLLSVVIQSGISMNFSVVSANGKMPVRDDYICENNITLLEQEEHFYYCDKSEIKYWYLSDIFHIFHRIYSLGDIVMYLSFFIMVIVLVIYIKNEIKIKKEFRK